MKAQAFVFDAYGTLFDVHAAIAQYRGDVGPDADRLSELWRSKQLEYTWTLTLAGQYLDFWQLTERALDYAFARFPSADRRTRAKLLQAYRELEAFPDARSTLAKLKARGERTAILSNGTEVMLQTAVRAAGIATDLDHVLSVERVGIYKPRAEVYALVPDAMQVEPRNVVFVSSNRWDVMGAASFGFRTAWINRSKLPDEYPGSPAELILGSLADLLTLANGSD